MDGTVEGIEVVGEKDSYVGLVQTVSSYTYSRKCPVVVDKVGREHTKKVLREYNEIILK